MVKVTTLITMLTIKSHVPLKQFTKGKAYKYHELILVPTFIGSNDLSDVGKFLIV